MNKGEKADMGSIRAVGYIRVGEQDQNEMSMFAQKECIETYSKMHGLDLLGVESDVSSSKDLKNRPAAKRVIEMAKDGTVSHIVFVKLDRFFRSANEILNLSHELDKAGVSLHSIEDNIDTKSAMGKLYFRITAAFAEFEQSLIADKTKEALAYKKRKGEKIGYRAPMGKTFGATVKAINGKEVVMVVDNEKELEAIQKTKELFKQSLSYRQIAEVLASQGYVSRAGKPYPPSTIRKFVYM